ncbi:MAG: hypothetical protein UT82_C0030G0003 [Parcubacteria group bacterium GW2011_GWB1_40_14]|nr:MAG: hypothetical protein UT82_C0030G0003 [Parcubacteria group bacterium GW2011_GWB1_40_14]
MKKIPNIPKFYDTDYLLVEGDGTSYADGFKLNRPLKKALLLGGNLKNKKVLDLASGRGEFAYHCAMKGGRVVGVDFSKDSIKLGKYIKGKLMMDVIEHLPQRKLEKSVAEAYRVVKPGGRIIIHTIPNALFTQTGYKLAKIFFGVTKWNSSVYHINEQSYFSLRSLLRKLKIKGTIEIEKEKKYFFVEIGNNQLLHKQLGNSFLSRQIKPLTIFLDKIFDNFPVYQMVSHFPLNLFFGTDFWITINKK